MAQPVIMQRLEEAVDSCAAMEDDAKAAHEPLDELLRGVNGLSEMLESEGTETESAIDDGLKAITDLRTALEDAGQEARNQAEALTQRARSLQDESEAALQTVRDRLTEIDEQRSALLQVLEDGVQMSQEKCQEISSRIEALQNEAGDGIQQAMAGIAELNGAVDQARTDIQSANSRWGQSIGGIAESSQMQTTETVTEVFNLLHTLGRSLVDSGNSVIEEHNAAVDEIWQGHAVDTPEFIAAGMEAVTEALNDLESVRSEHSGTIQATSPQLAEQIRGVSGQLEELQSAMSDSISRVPQVD